MLQRKPPSAQEMNCGGKNGNRLVNLHRGEEVVDEVEGDEEPDGAGGEHDGGHHEQRVADVEGGGHRPAEAVQVEHKVVDGVEEDVEGHGAGGEERLPPPAVILHAEVHVGEHDGDLGADDDEQHQHDEQEAKDVVDAAHPDARHDEEELDEERAEGERAGAQHQQPGRVALGGNLARDLVGAHGERDRLRLGAQVPAEKRQGDGDREPEQEQDEEERRRNSARAAHGPQNAVEHAQDAEHDPGEERGRLPRDRLPPRRTPLDGAPEAGRDIAGHTTQEEVQQHHARQQHSPRRRRHEPQSSAEDGDHRHGQDLHSVADRNAENLRTLRRAEHIPDHQLPPGELLRHLRLRLLVQLLVLGQVPPHCPQKDHEHDPGEERDHHERVQDREPVHASALHLEVRVPPAGPPNGADIEHHVVGEHERLPDLDCLVSAVRATCDGLQSTVILHFRRGLGVAHDAARHDLKPYHHVGAREVLLLARGHGVQAITGAQHGHHGGLALVRVDEHLEAQVVVDVVLGAPVELEPDRRPSPPERHGRVALLGVARHGQVVEHEVHLVEVVDPLLEVLHILLRQRLRDAQLHIGLVLAHLEHVRRILDLVAHEQLSNILRHLLNTVHRPAERQAVVRVRELRLDRRDRVHLHIELSAVRIRMQVAPGKVKRVHHNTRPPHLQEHQPTHRLPHSSPRSRHRAPSACPLKPLRTPITSPSSRPLMHAPHRQPATPRHHPTPQI
jgi:hypothetical protein